MDIPKWEGPTICESSQATSESNNDVKPPGAVTANERVKKELIKEERKREATALTDDGSVKEETVTVKKEKPDSTVATNDKK